MWGEGENVKLDQFYQYDPRMVFLTALDPFPIKKGVMGISHVALEWMACSSFPLCLSPPTLLCCCHNLPAPHNVRHRQRNRVARTPQRREISRLVLSWMTLLLLRALCWMGQLAGHSLWNTASYPLSLKTHHPDTNLP